jgi:serine/threonine protein phosphatase PrpC
MGHGIASSLTSYSISAIIQQKVRAVSNFKELMESILDNVQYILTDEEQLTCGFFWFKEDLSAVEYVVAGMYAPMLLDGEKIVLAKANNIPFMNFAFDVSITTIELNDFKRFLIFTDGLVEDTKDLDVDLERLIIEDDYIQDVFKKLNEMELEDDTTIIRISTK